MQFVPNKSSIIALIRFFDLRFFSLPAKGRDKIVWSVRFRRARRTIVRRAAKSGAEKAKTSNFKQESVRIPDASKRGEIKKMQNRRKSSRRRTIVRQRRFSAVEKAKTLFHLLKESARIPTSFRKSNYTKAVFKKLVFAFSVCAFLAFTQRGEIKKMQKRRNTTRRRTGVRQRRVSAVEKADNYFFGEIR